MEQVKEKAEGRESMFRMYTVLMVALSIRFAFEYLVSFFFHGGSHFDTIVPPDQCVDGEWRARGTFETAAPTAQGQASPEKEPALKGGRGPAIRQ